MMNVPLRLSYEKQEMMHVCFITVEREREKTLILIHMWVFIVKYKADGCLERYKTRFVAKGYAQTYGVDCQETFTPVVKMNTVIVLLSMTIQFDWDSQ